MERDAVAGIVFDLFVREVVLKSRTNDAGGDAIHPNIAISQFARQRARELRDRALHYSVSDRPGATTSTRGRGDQQDDAAAVSGHEGNRRPRQMVNGVDVDIESSVPRAGIH